MQCPSYIDKAKKNLKFNINLKTINIYIFNSVVFNPCRLETPKQILLQTVTDDKRLYSVCQDNIPTGTASAHSVKSGGIRPRMYIDDLL